jgi:HEAT repeat protein
MKRLLILGALLAGGSLCLQDISVGHGGTYRGPGDTVPPGGGGGGGGGTGPTGPGPSGPSTGGPAGPSTGGPGGGGPSTGGGGAPKGPSTGGGGSGTDLTTWEYWWGFNKDPYLNLKAAIYAGVTTGSEDFFGGQGSSKQPKNALKPSEQSIREKVVPALKEALLKERANDIVTGALIALGKIGDVKNEDGSSEFEPILAGFLGDPNQEIAETSAVALGILANEASVPKLKDLALDTPAGRKAAGTGSSEVKYRTRAFATYGLGLIGYRTSKNEVRQEVARTLIALLGQKDSAQKDIKVAAMIALGLVPVDVDHSETADSKSNDYSASRQSEIKFVKKFYQSTGEHYLVRAHAPVTLSRLLRPAAGGDAPPEMREDIARMLLDGIAAHTTEKQPEVLQSCVLALGQIGTADKSKIDTEIRTALKHLVDGNADQQVKNFSLIAMAQVGGRGKGEDCEAGRKEARSHILTQLTKSGGSTSLRPWAGLSIGVMERALKDAGEQQSGDAKEVLHNALKDAKSPDQVGAYAIGVGIAQDMEAKTILKAKLAEIADTNARGYVCLGIGLIDDREQIKEIQTIVKESRYKPELLRQAAIALGLMGDKDLVPELCDYLKEAKALAAQAALASALGFIGDARSIDPLVKMLQQKEHITDTARGFAAVALGIVADKELLPWNSKVSTNLNYRASVTTLTGEGLGLLDIL